MEEDCIVGDGGDCDDAHDDARDFHGQFYHDGDADFFHSARRWTHTFGPFFSSTPNNYIMLLSNLILFYSQ